MSEVDLNTYEGKCKFCGELQPIMAMGQTDADEKISEQCACGGAAKARQKENTGRDTMNGYYRSCAIPKPQTKKRARTQNGWKDKPNRYCYYTGQPYAQRHELFQGSPGRQISIENRFQIDLHPAIHALFHRRIDQVALKALNISGIFPVIQEVLAGVLNGWGNQIWERLKFERRRTIVWALLR